MKHIAGIIGFGGMANYHFDQLKDYERMDFKGVYDVDPSREKIALEKGAKFYESKEALLSDPEIDIVLIATTNEVHKELAIEAMAAGKNVICEKPVTNSSEELVEIMEAAKKYGKVFTIDQNRRTNRDFVLMRRNVEAGLIGKPYTFKSRVEGSRGMPEGWRTIKKYGGGMMLDWGVHLIDQMMYMIDEKVTSVYCKMHKIQYPEVEDNFSLIITFESGIQAVVEVGTNNYITQPRWYVLGETGTLQIDSWDCDGKIIRNIDKENVWEEQIIYTKAGPTKTMAPRNKNSTETIEISEPLDVVDHLSVVYDQFIDAIEGKADLTITADQAMRVMKVMEASFESDEKNEVIKTNI